MYYPNSSLVKIRYRVVLYILRRSYSCSWERLERDWNQCYVLIYHDQNTNYTVKILKNLANLIICPKYKTMLKNQFLYFCPCLLTIAYFLFHQDPHHFSRLWLSLPQKRLWLWAIPQFFNGFFIIMMPTWHVSCHWCGISKFYSTDT